MKSRFATAGIVFVKFTFGLFLLSVLMISTALPARATNSSMWDLETQPYSGSLNITVYRDPSCGCCKNWIQHLKTHGFRVTDIESSDMESIKENNGIPANLASCHTGIVNGYVIEGHVPADDVKHLLLQKPAIAGLTVPAMPVGTPGMEVGTQKDAFDVISFDNQVTVQVFQGYLNY